LLRPRVLLADDHPALLEAITALLKARFDVVGTATDGASLVSEALRLCPDIVVADITMPILSGIDAAHWLRESAFPAKIVFLTIHSEEQFMKAWMAEGTSGYILKSHMKTHLIQRYKQPLSDNRTFVHSSPRAAGAEGRQCLLMTSTGSVAICSK
jgi:DNA-binding NarL/FixJ family response regulator